MTKKRFGFRKAAFGKKLVTLDSVQNKKFKMFYGHYRFVEPIHLLVRLLMFPQI
jgi:hypothetical protein